MDTVLTDECCGCDILCLSFHSFCSSLCRIVSPRLSPLLLFVLNRHVQLFFSVSSFLTGQLPPKRATSAQPSVPHLLGPQSLRGTSHHQRHLPCLTPCHALQTGGLQHPCHHCSPHHRHLHSHPITAAFYCAAAAAAAATVVVATL